MLIDVSVFKRKVREAWRSTGLEVAIDSQEKWMHISGNDWYIIMDTGTVTNKMKAALIELIGEMPRPGWMVTCQKGVEKLVDDDWVPKRDPRTMERPVRWHTSLTLLDTENNGVCRVLEKDGSSEKVVIREATREMVNPVDSARDYEGPISAEGGYWIAYRDGFTLVLISMVNECGLEGVQGTLQLLQTERTECFENEYLQR